MNDKLNPKQCSDALRKAKDMKASALALAIDKETTDVQSDSLLLLAESFGMAELHLQIALVRLIRETSETIPF
jgi:hypothetical protein